MDHTKHRQQHDDEDQRQQAECPALDRLLLGRVGRWVDAEGTEGAGDARAVGEDTDQHSETGDAKAPVPAHALAQVAGKERGEEGAGVDPHVEDGEAGVATGAAFGIQIADERRHVRLEQPGPDHDQDEAEEEGRLREDGRQRDADVPGGDEQAAVPNRALQAEPSIGDPAAGERREVHAGRVDADDRRCLRALEAEAAVGERGGHEEDEEGADPVVREALPHLGGEERRESARLPEEAAVGDEGAASLFLGRRQLWRRGWWQQGT